MKFLKIYFFILIFAFCFYGLNIFAVNPGQFPDVLRLQPISPGVHPYTPGNTNKNGQNSKNNSLLLSQINQYQFDVSELDPNTSYIDTVGHLLFVTDTDNNRVFVFDLSPDNVLIDYSPDYVLGQPDFTSSDPGTTQSTFDGPTGIAYDEADKLLFVADTNNNRIMVFDVASITNGEDAVNVLGQPDFTSSDPGTTQSTFDGPLSLDYDSVNKILFVTDANNNRIVTFDINLITNGEDAVNVLGQPDFTSSDPGTTQSKLNDPGALSYDEGSKNLFVVDTKNIRVMVFGDKSITNGENAVNIISKDDFPAMAGLMNKTTAAKMQAKPKIIAKRPYKKNNSWQTILLWLAIVLLIVIFIIALFLYLRKKMKESGISAFLH